jgi:hypothetical protein
MPRPVKDITLDEERADVVRNEAIVHHAEYARRTRRPNEDYLAGKVEGARRRVIDTELRRHELAVEDRREHRNLRKSRGTEHEVFEEEACAMRLAPAPAPWTPKKQ